MKIHFGTMTGEQFLSRLRAEGFPPPADITRDAGDALDDHAHAFEAWGLVTEGEFFIEVEGVVSRFPAGHSFRLPPGTPHREWAGPQGARYLAGRKERVA